MIKKRPKININNCESCKLCIQVCPVYCIKMTNLGKHGKYKNVFPCVDETICIGCGQCAKACVLDCIEMEEVK